MTFDKDVTAHAADLAVRGSAGATYSVSGYAYDPATHTGTWTLAQALAPGTARGDRVALALSAAGVTAGGLALDGEFATGAAMPSGNGTPGGDFVFNVNVLPGDADRSGRVSALDLSFVKQRLNTIPVSRPVPGGYSVFGDFDAGGRISALDLSAVKQRLNTQLPPASPAPAPAAFTGPVFADRRIDDAAPPAATSLLLS
jgi:hypothetical protein